MALSGEEDQESEGINDEEESDLDSLLNELDVEEEGDGQEEESEDSDEGGDEGNDAGDSETVQEATLRRLEEEAKQQLGVEQHEPETVVAPIPERVPTMQHVPVLPEFSISDEDYFDAIDSKDGMEKVLKKQAEYVAANTSAQVMSQVAGVTTDTLTGLLEPTFALAFCMNERPDLAPYPFALAKAIKAEREKNPAANFLELKEKAIKAVDAGLKTKESISGKRIDVRKKGVVTAKGTPTRDARVQPSRKLDPTMEAFRDVLRAK